MGGGRNGAYAEAVVKFEPSFVGDHLEEPVDLVNWDGAGYNATNSAVHNARLDIQIFELLLELVHNNADLLQIHALHRLVHTDHYRRHIARYLVHRHSRLDPRGYSINARR
ncbi:hypothetical protein AYI69_g2633 [Smittium culicis]|uniref:Uncharacterized protein n=1 Tax=Smittium culicis TaxID=133412 RepID=A0A1R1YLX0_9FUNG|nr:hypothetical protein AYI69_g2633 [Smittium culicis]